MRKLKSKALFYISKIIFLIKIFNFESFSVFKPRHQHLINYLKYVGKISHAAPLISVIFIPALIIVKIKLRVINI